MYTPPITLIDFDYVSGSHIVIFYRTLFQIMSSVLLYENIIGKKDLLNVT